LDGDGKPEFLVGFAQYAGVDGWDFYLYMWEATGNNNYERTLVAQRRINTSSSVGRRSKCGDIDGDGIEELVWATPTMVYAFKATGNNQFTQVWQEVGNGSYEELLVNIYDVNRNGYNEIIITGSNRTAIYEVEAVRIIRPWGGMTFYGNSQEQILWETFYPPRCDSLSLFYSLDNGRTYDTIITGIPGTDTSYLWRVPNVSSDSCKVKIIAYGPGWQYDESDGVFRITPTGIEENTSQYIKNFRFEVFPNPATGKVSFKIWDAGKKNLSLKIYNLAGELVRTLILTTKNQQPTTFIWDGRDGSGKKLPAGVYFYRLKTSDGFSETKELIILK
jgi:hypothetical protein